ncbi:hypothetical protein H2199_006969 [Coniosporium tulheliwenetii]|uniref:Uncharacterized protein n=1 Tax=Coniosporium tulheliwenetii TaxID=3383036 RepID=A0ACC2YSG1_9PEZI|nr:hypothetical protein H2199_006969 [Cladosporium sp. JES 115]
MRSQENEIQTGIRNGEDPAQDARNAYSAGHLAALAQGERARTSGSTSDLKEAYFMEAFAQHFLTDLFSTGHMRTPRRVLHEPYSDVDPPPDGPDYPDLDLWPADACAQIMHNEDSANGLWVSNSLGETWAAYGDRQLWSDYVPLFEWSATDPDILRRRANLDERNISAFKEYSISSLGDREWQRILDTIQNSSVVQSMHPFTLSFLSSTKVWHFRSPNDDTLIVNNYGPVDAAEFEKYWSMEAQYNIQLPQIAGSTSWASVQSLGHGIHSLVGRLRPPNKEFTTARHIAVRAVQDEKGASVELAWVQHVKDQDDAWTLGDIVYGRFSRDSRDVAMIKHWFTGPRGTTKLELWVIAASLNTPPIRVDPNLPCTPMNFLLGYKMHTRDNHETFVGFGYNNISSTSTWQFFSWSSNYSKRHVSTVSEAIGVPAQALLSGSLGASDGDNRIIRIFYGQDHPNPDSLDIDILHPVRSSSGRVSIPDPPISRSFPVTWEAVSEEDYLFWFLSDVNQDGRIDLVALVSLENQFTVLVFPGLRNGTFGTPVVSEITLDPDRGSLMSAPWMRIIKVSQAEYTYTSGSRNVANDRTKGLDYDSQQPIRSFDSQTTDAAIMMFFDNYGILGTRLLAPVRSAGTYFYELKGQTPSIAGQPTQAIGWRGREAVGFVFN